MNPSSKAGVALTSVVAAVGLTVFKLAIGLGTWLATRLPWMPASRLGPQRLAAYVVPYLLVVGDREKEHGAVAVRTRSGEDLGTMSIADFAQRLRNESAA